MTLLDALVTVTKHNLSFLPSEESKIESYYQKAIDEKRLVYLRNETCIIGFLVFYLFDENKLSERIRNLGTFIIPEHNPNSECLYIDTCIVFREYAKNVNLVYLRNMFREMFPQVKVASWHKTTKEGRKLFKFNCNGG